MSNIRQQLLNFSNLLAQIFTWLWFFQGFSAQQNGFTYTLIPCNPNPNHNPEAIHNPNHNPNPSPKQSNSFLTNLSRDQNRFLPINFQGSIFTLRHGGDSESAYKNTPILITFIPLGPFHKNFLKIWASLLSF